MLFSINWRIAVIMRRVNSNKSYRGKGEKEMQNAQEIKAKIPTEDRHAVSSMDILGGNK